MAFPWYFLNILGKSIPEGFSNLSKFYTAIFSVVISTTASRDKILRRSPDVEFTSDSPTQLRDVIWIKYISTTTEEM